MLLYHLLSLLKVVVIRQKRKKPLVTGDFLLSDTIHPYLNILKRIRLIIMLLTIVTPKVLLIEKMLTLQFPSFVLIISKLYIDA